MPAPFAILMLVESRSSFILQERRQIPAPCFTEEMGNAGFWIIFFSQRLSRVLRCFVCCNTVSGYADHDWILEVCRRGSHGFFVLEMGNDIHFITYFGAWVRMFLISN